MGKSKEKYIEIHDPLSERYYEIIQKIIKDEELLYEQLDCDISPKDIE
tara:strand:+ start:176 stop:319 length:144 start_codon:yes stop_codon:yes gene_type:complete